MLPLVTRSFVNRCFLPWQGSSRLLNLKPVCLVRDVALPRQITPTFGARSFTSSQIRGKKLSSSLAMLGGAAFVASCLYNLSQQPSSFTAQIVHSNLQKAYGALFLSVAAAFAVARLLAPRLMHMNQLLILGPAMIVAIFGANYCRAVSYERDKAFKILLHLAVCASVGATLAFPLAYINSAALTQAALCAGTLFSGLCIAGSCSSSGRFDNASGVLSVGLLIVFAASIANIFAPPHVKLFQNIYAYLGLPVVSGLTLLSANQIYDDAYTCGVHSIPFDPINAALPMFFNLINLFNMILSLQQRKNR